MPPLAEELTAVFVIAWHLHGEVVFRPDGKLAVVPVGVIGGLGIADMPPIDSRGKSRIEIGKRSAEERARVANIGRPAATPGA